MSEPTQTKVLAATVTLDFAERFRAVAKGNDRSMNAELRRAAERHVEAEEKRKAEQAEKSAAA